jgi:uncharacterized membrane protein
MGNIVIALVNLFCGLLYIGLAIPLYKEKVEMNYLYGVRFTKSYKSDENWYKINKYGAKRMIFWSIPLIGIGLVLLFLPPLSEQALAILSFAPLIVLIPAFQSYLYSRKQ